MCNAQVIISLHVRFISKGSCHFRCTSFDVMESISKADPSIHTRLAARNIRGSTERALNVEVNVIAPVTLRRHVATIAKEFAAIAITGRDPYRQNRSPILYHQPQPSTSRTFDFIIKLSSRYCQLLRLPRVRFTSLSRFDLPSNILFVSRPTIFILRRKAPVSNF